MPPSSTMSLDDFFRGKDEARDLYEIIAREIADLGEATVRVSKSQVAFQRAKNVAIVWTPGQYLEGPVAPLVLTLSFPARAPSPRWKEIIEAAPHRFTHHLELRAVEEIDDEVRAWLRAAWNAAIEGQTYSCCLCTRAEVGTPRRQGHHS